MPKGIKSESPEQLETVLNQKILTEHQRIARSEQTLKRLNYKKSSDERRKRTHRLIQLGAIVEHWLQEEGDPETLSSALQYEIFTDSDQLLGEFIREIYMEAQNANSPDQTSV